MLMQYICKPLSEQAPSDLREGSPEMVCCGRALKRWAGALAGSSEGAIDAHSELLQM